MLTPRRGRVMGVACSLYSKEHRASRGKRAPIPCKHTFMGGRQKEGLDEGEVARFEAEAADQRGLSPTRRFEPH